MKRIVLTGGPGGGKTTAADLFRRELGARVAVVPEAATLLYTGGFPRSNDLRARCAAQKTIYSLQRNLEDVIAAIHPDAILLCDRGTIDGAVYWPGESAAFFDAVHSSCEAELSRYDAVVFFESGAVGGVMPNGDNTWRTESLDEAAELDRRLREIWSQHPHFTVVPHDPSFFHKVTLGFETLEQIVAELQKGRAL